MKLHAAIGTALMLGLVAGPGIALAEDATPTPSAPTTIYTRDYIQIDPSQADVTPFDQVMEGGQINSHTIYLNNCRANNGCNIAPGGEDSTYSANGYDGRSSIINGNVHISALASNVNWAQVMQCVRDTYAPFNINITDVDPGTAPHWENIVAGSPTEAGFQNGVGGVSPFTCGIINNSITYSFANIYGGSIVDICWTVAQETAHSWGLDHEFLKEDPMTYLDGSSLPGGYKRFQNQNVSCGEYQARNCQCGGSTQNSYTWIQGLFGSSTPTPPVVQITEPAAGAQVEPGFVVRATITDDNGVASATLQIDGNTIQTSTTPPFIFNAPGDLAEGTHRVTVTATDSQGTPGSSFVDVNIGPPCETPADCADQGDNLTCVGGRCVPGEGSPGGLGTECTDGTQCYSGQCASDGTNSYCVETCTIGGSDCPGGFTCLNAGGNGVCWPGGDGGGGGCSADGSSSSGAPIALGIALAGLLTIRRRKAKA